MTTPTIETLIADQMLKLAGIKLRSIEKMKAEFLPADYTSPSKMEDLMFLHVEVNLLKRYADCLRTMSAMDLRNRLIKQVVARNSSLTSRSSSPVSNFLQDQELAIIGKMLAPMGLLDIDG